MTELNKKNSQLVDVDFTIDVLDQNYLESSNDGCWEDHRSTTMAIRPVRNY